MAVVCLTGAPPTPTAELMPLPADLKAEVGDDAVRLLTVKMEDEL